MDEYNLKHIEPSYRELWELETVCSNSDIDNVPESYK